MPHCITHCFLCHTTCKQVQHLVASNKTCFFARFIVIALDDRTQSACVEHEWFRHCQRYWQTYNPSEYLKDDYIEVRRGWLWATVTIHIGIQFQIEHLRYAFYNALLQQKNTLIGLTKTVYMHCIWLYIRWFPRQKCRIYTVYKWFWPTLHISNVVL